MIDGPEQNFALTPESPRSPPSGEVKTVKTHAHKLLPESPNYSEIHVLRNEVFLKYMTDDDIYAFAITLCVGQFCSVEL